MRFSEDNIADGYYISAYEAGQVHINGRAFRSSLVIASDQLLDDWPPNSIDELISTHIDAVLRMQPEVVLLGTGQKLAFPEISTYAALIQQGIGVEVMDTAAACRTYNILMGEGRRVVAGLIIPG